MSVNFYQKIKFYIGRLLLTKYVVGAKANPPKNESRPPKKGKVMPTNIVSPAMKKGSQSCFDIKHDMINGEFTYPHKHYVQRNEAIL